MEIIEGHGKSWKIMVGQYIPYGTLSVKRPPGKGFRQSASMQNGRPVEGWWERQNDEVVQVMLAVLLNSAPALALAKPSQA